MFIDLDRRLFPVRLPQTRTNSLYKVPMDNGRTRDAHVNAIKYFRRAMSLATNMTPALLPLVQVLLCCPHFYLFPKNLVVMMKVPPSRIGQTV